MSTIGPASVFSVTIASATTFSSAVDLAGAWGKIGLHVPSMASGADIRIRVCNTATGTFIPLYHAPTVASATPTVVNIPSSITNCVIPLVIPSRYVQVQLTSMCSDTTNTFMFHCSSN